MALTYDYGMKTVSALSTFVLAMVKYPAVQAKAQTHLEQVLGSNQLPSYDDEPSLPYITAIMLEVLRWQPVLPLSIAHLNTEEDNYKGYTIPAGSVVIPNAWCVDDFVAYRPSNMHIQGNSA